MDFSALTAGGPIPAVSPGDLRGVWEIMRDPRAEFSGSRDPDPGGQQPTVGISIRVLAQACSPDANVVAVWARSTFLGILVDQGLLTSWQRGTRLHDAVFDLAATFVVQHSHDGFDPDAFLQQLPRPG